MKLAVAVIFLCIFVETRGFSIRYARQAIENLAASQQQIAKQSSPVFNNFNPQNIAAGFSQAGRPGFEFSQQQLLPQQQQQERSPNRIPFSNPASPQVEIPNADFKPQQEIPQQFQQQLPNTQLQQQVQQPHQQQQFTPPAPTLPSLSTTIAKSEQSEQQQSTPTTPKVTSPPPVDKNVDLDGDGALSLAEVQYAAFVHHGLSSSVVENLFNQVDLNKDGYLSSTEFNEIRPLVLVKAENAAQRYLQNVDTNHNGLLSLQEAQAYILKEYGISNRDVERIWRLVVPSSGDEMDAVLFSKLRRRVRGMSIRLARQIMKMADKNEDGHIDLNEARAIAFEQEGISAGDVIEMLASVDDNNDGELNAPEFADFERIVRARAVDTSKKALKVVDTDGSGTLTMDEAKFIAFDHYGFDEATLEPFFAQADENEDGQLDAVEFAGFRSVIRSRAVKNAVNALPEMDEDGNGMISTSEAEHKARQDDDMDSKETIALFNVADQDRSGQLDKVELADFIRLIRLSAIKFVTDHFRDYDTNRDKLVTIDELEGIVHDRYKVDTFVTRRLFDKVDVDRSGDLSPGEIVDFRHEIRRYVADRNTHAELDAQNRREMAEIEAKLRAETEQTKANDENAGENEDDTPILNDVKSQNESSTSIAVSSMEEVGKEDSDAHEMIEGFTEASPKTEVTKKNENTANNTNTIGGNAPNSDGQIDETQNESSELEEVDSDGNESPTESTLTTTTTITTTPSTTTITKTHKKRRRHKIKTTVTPIEENPSSGMKMEDMNMFVHTTAVSEVEETTVIKNVPKRRRKLKKTTTTTTELPTTSSTTTTTTTTTPTTTTTTTTTEATTTKTISTGFTEYEECKEGDQDCEEVTE